MPDRRNPLVEQVAAAVADPSASFRVLAELSAKAGRGSELAQLFAGVPRKSEREPGCMLYRFSCDVGDSDAFVSWEEWRDIDALAAHFRTDHMGVVSARLPELLSKEIKLTILAPAA